MDKPSITKSETTYYHICPICGKGQMITNTEQILTSFPPMYIQTCDICGHIEYVYCKDYNPIYEPTFKSKEYGWICPKCGMVNAPWVASCPCNGGKITFTCNSEKSLL